MNEADKTATRLRMLLAWASNYGDVENISPFDDPRSHLPSM